MTEELSGVTVVIIVGGGVLMCIILFIFAKRQIMRFALRSRRGPHVAIGHDAKKSLRKEIERRIDAIPHVVHEPRLLDEETSRYILAPGGRPPAHYYRFKAVDDIKILEEEIARQSGGLRRHPRESVRKFLLAALVNAHGPKLVQQLCDAYEHARHDPSDFGDDEYHAYSRLLLKLCDAARLLKNFNSSSKTSPSRGAAGKQAAARAQEPRLKPPGSLGVTLCSNKLAVTALHNNHYTTLQVSYSSRSLHNFKRSSETSPSRGAAGKQAAAHARELGRKPPGSLGVTLCSKKLAVTTLHNNHYTTLQVSYASRSLHNFKRSSETSPSRGAAGKQAAAHARELGRKPPGSLGVTLCSKKLAVTTLHNNHYTTLQVSYASRSLHNFKRSSETSPSRGAAGKQAAAHARELGRKPPGSLGVTLCSKKLAVTTLHNNHYTTLQVSYASRSLHNFKRSSETSPSRGAAGKQAAAHARELGRKPPGSLGVTLCSKKLAVTTLHNNHYTTLQVSYASRSLHNFKRSSETSPSRGAAGKQATARAREPGRKPPGSLGVTLCSKKLAVTTLHNNHYTTLQVSYASHSLHNFKRSSETSPSRGAAGKQAAAHARELGRKPPGSLGVTLCSKKLAVTTLHNNHYTTLQVSYASRSLHNFKRSSETSPSRGAAGKQAAAHARELGRKPPGSLGVTLCSKKLAVTTLHNNHYTTLQVSYASRSLHNFKRSSETSPSRGAAGKQAAAHARELGRKPPGSLGVTLCSKKLAVTTLHNNHYTTLQVSYASRSLHNFKRSSETSPSRGAAGKQATARAREPGRKPPGSLGVTLCSKKLAVTTLHNNHYTTLQVSYASRSLQNFNSSSEMSPSRGAAVKQVAARAQEPRLKSPGPLGVTLCDKLAVTGLHNNHYTALQNVSLESKVEEEVAAAPARAPTTVSIPGQKADNETTV